MAPTRQDQRHCGGAGKARGETHGLVTRPVVAAGCASEGGDLDSVFEDSLPAFGGSDLRRVWQLLDEAIGLGLPMSLAVSGPVTLSGQHLTWLNPLLDTGWFVLVSTTDAVCYHDGHRALDGSSPETFFHVDRDSDDGRLREERTIRVTDVAFPEDTLLEQDRYLRTVLAQDEFQKRMSGTEFRSRLGRRFAAQERANGVPEGMLALCWRKAIPIFVGAPADGSVFLNALALWADAETSGAENLFELDLYREVFESCAFHRACTQDSAAAAMGTLILGGGVPKNFNLQPEPTLSQIFGLEHVPGFLYDIQITTAPVSDGSLSSCPPSEAVTWGKVDKDSYRSTCVSLSADYTTVMPFLARALLQKRARFERWRGRMGADALFEEHPAARGYLRDPAGMRLFDRRDELCDKLLEQLRQRSHDLDLRSDYPLAPLDPSTDPA